MASYLGSLAALLQAKDPARADTGLIEAIGACRDLLAARRECGDAFGDRLRQVDEPPVRMIPSGIEPKRKREW
jgi:hypothetical protein